MRNAQDAVVESSGEECPLRHFVSLNATSPASQGRMLT